MRGSSAVARARGTLTVLAHVPAQRRAQRLPREPLARLRDRRIGETVRYAAETVPHYRELLRDTATSVAGAKDLQALPLLEKATVQEDPERFRSSSAAGRSAIGLQTTGSTGLPVVVFHDRRSLLANIAYSERERAVEAHVVGKRYGYPVLAVNAPAGTVNRVQAFYAHSTFRPGRPELSTLGVDAPADEVLAAVERLRPAVIRGYGGYLELLFRLASATGGLRHRPAAVVYAGDTMSRAGRELIEREFGVPVLSAYNAVECFKIAFTCEERAGFAADVRRTLSPSGHHHVENAA